MIIGDRVRVVAGKPVAGGRMLARHDGIVVLVAGAISGETVEVEVERVQRAVAWARVVEVVDASADRVSSVAGACGGTVLAHVRYERQIALKQEILHDAFARIGRLTLPEEVAVTASPVEGYRIRARFHLAGGRLGFYREGTHELCDPAETGQLQPETVEAVEALAVDLRDLAGQVAEVQMNENRAASERAFHLKLRTGTRRSALRDRVSSRPWATGMSCGTAESSAFTLWGTPIVSDVLRLTTVADEIDVRVARRADAFFQSNRFLLMPLATAVSDLVDAGRVLELYAGVGLFASVLAAGGQRQVMAIEGDAASAEDLAQNLAPFGALAEARHQSVETFLQRNTESFDTVIVDPPRTGMSKAALQGLLTLQPPRLVYVSCDVATLARDARALVAAGYSVVSMRGFDLFPNTAHLEVVALFER